MLPPSIPKRYWSGCASPWPASTFTRLRCTSLAPRGYWRPSQLSSQPSKRASPRTSLCLSTWEMLSNFGRETEGHVRPSMKSQYYVDDDPNTRGSCFRISLV